MGRALEQWPKRNYGVILADPPWPLRGGKGGRQGYSKTMSADVQYPVMTVKQIKALRVGDISMPDSHLFLWVPSMYVPDGLSVMGEWGFRYVTNVCWVKTGGRIGLGQYFRTAHELCLFGVKGHVPYARVDGKRPTIPSVFYADRGRHSAKPATIHWVAEQLSPAPRIELFARSRRKGWDAWGNQLTAR